MKNEFRTGDAVKHLPSGETWWVAWADEQDVYPGGWPESMGRVSDCLLVRKCTDEQHLQALREVASGVPERVSGWRAAARLRQLEAAAWPEQLEVQS